MRACGITERYETTIDAAGTGDEIVVTNGVYAAGGRAVGTNLLLHDIGRFGLYSAHEGRTERLPGLLHLDSLGYLTESEERGGQTRTDRAGQTLRSHELSRTVGVVRGSLRVFSGTGFSSRKRGVT